MTKKMTVHLIGLTATILLLSGVSLVRAKGLPTAWQIINGLTWNGTSPEGEPQILQFTFDNGLDGWTTGHMGGEYDSAEWSEDHGNPPGSVRLDGSDLGASDGQPNSWMSRVITLPANFDLLYFETKANVDGALRVRLVDEGGTSHILLPWEVLAGESWRERTANIAPYAGQTVTLYFEQGDNDVGNGEHRYVDNVILCESISIELVDQAGNGDAGCVQPALNDKNFLPFFTAGDAPLVQAAPSPAP